ncbi:multidrug ABC transporter ATP-binding protein [Aerococcus urinaehominis]|uniref:Multidrug ABC transporter ATP-binding protein n=1 Tax=Aerococcus urinaehominis TaxID=128944 RepID=A0A0X8FLM7_9LACT|nr:ABC transporter ATP-binding protein [Aerococcus urinaehominis]AMB99586.1 multidrug ABC transporter ATP-binding protein [Aerococcus urinaehominis]SDL86497.1 ABC-2 type transport system ATP-binding protein [Aerococcus urinaehominis]
MTLVVNHLSGGYLQRPIIHDLSFNLAPGEVVALIGLNGAGKSTTIKHLIGLMQPMQGEILLAGNSLKSNPSQYRQDFTYIPETPILYEELTLREHIELTGLTHGLDPKESLVQAKPLLERFRLADRLDWLPIHFSKGMKQKVMIVTAFMLDVPLYVIDEPFLGLDPLGIRDFLQVLKDKQAKGASILMSTHVLASAEKYCDRFLFLHEGRLKAQGSLSDIQASFQMPEASLEDLYLYLADQAGDQHG